MNGTTKKFIFTLMVIGLSHALRVSAQETSEVETAYGPGRPPAAPTSAGRHRAERVTPDFLHARPPRDRELGAVVVEKFDRLQKETRAMVPGVPTPVACPARESFVNGPEDAILSKDPVEKSHVCFGSKADLDAFNRYIEEALAAAMSVPEDQLPRGGDKKVINTYTFAHELDINPPGGLTGGERGDDVGQPAGVQGKYDPKIGHDSVWLELKTGGGQGAKVNGQSQGAPGKFYLRFLNGTHARPAAGKAGLGKSPQMDFAGFHCMAADSIRGGIEGSMTTGAKGGRDPDNPWLALSVILEERGRMKPDSFVNREKAGANVRWSFQVAPKTYVMPSVGVVYFKSLAKRVYSVGPSDEREALRYGFTIKRVLE